MEKMLEFDNNYNPTRKFYKKLSEEDKKIINRFEEYCLVSASPGRAKKAKSNAIRFLTMINKKINKVSLEDLQNFLRLLKESNFSDYMKNDVKGYVQRFLRWHFKDWSERFNNFEDIKYVSEPQRAKQITPEDVLSKEDIEKLIKEEKDVFWKAFIIVQYQGALRTQETRTLMWDMINMEDSDVYWLNVKSKKNKNAQEKERPAPPLEQQAIYFLNELKKEQNITNKKSLYVFPSKHDLNAPISSATTNMWFRRLTKKVLGRSVTNYLLRHSKGEELHKLVREGKLSKENATLMMGHSEKMFDKTYSHTNKRELLKLLKKQVLNVDYIAPEKKHELELKIEEMQKQLQEEIEERKRETKEKKKEKQAKIVKSKEVDWDNMVFKRMMERPDLVPKILEKFKKAWEEQAKEEELNVNAKVKNEK